MVLTGAHPFQRWMELPGRRGWVPLVFFLLAVPCFPIWVCFHAGTLGTLLSWLTGTDLAWHGARIICGAWASGRVPALSALGGYAALERIQLVITLLMLGAVVVALFVLHPDWLEFLKGFVPQPLRYPSWITLETQREVAARPVWVETITYVGVIGGSSYDYLAYVSYLREKHWGRAGQSVASAAELRVVSGDPQHIHRRWLRAPLVDGTLSFLAVLLFSGVFVACGAVVLGPQHKGPGGTNLLALQAEFVTSLHPWLKYIYFGGAFLAVLGTLYGTIEVAPTVLREMAIALRPHDAQAWTRRLRLCALAWVGLGGVFILAWSLLYHVTGDGHQPPGLIAILTPANLFTGVLGCGLVCLFNAWMDRSFLPRGLQMPWAIALLNALAALTFLALGFKAYWDHSGWTAFILLTATLAVGWIAAWIAGQLSDKSKRGSREVPQ